MTHGEMPGLNILYFAPCGLGEGVGGGGRLRNMIDALRRLETKTQLLSYLSGEKFGAARQSIDRHLSTVTISARRSSPKIFKMFALGLVFTYGLKYIKKSDVIFAHAPTVASGLPALILAKIFRRPLLIDHMDIKDPDTPGFIYNLVLKKADLVFTISRYLEEEVKGIGGKRVVYLPIFLDADVFRKDALERAKIRKELGAGDKEIIIGYAGSFARIEGLPFLLKAFKNLAKKYANIKLVVVGGMNVADSDNVAQLVNELALKEKTVLVPQQPHELMPKYLSAFDIACSPKIDCIENRAANPIKIYEYMAMGLPMVVSAVGEVAKIIENGADGFLVKPGDEGDLARALEYVMQNPGLAGEVGERAREKVVRNYTQQVMLATIGDALRELGKAVRPSG